MSLVVFTALCRHAGRAGPRQSRDGAASSLLAIAVGAGASGALNMAYDADIDALMTRTRRRPDPDRPRRRAPEALAFGVDALGPLRHAARRSRPTGSRRALLAGTILFYAVVYTMWLKRATPQNIVIGGAAGALPPMIGYAVVTGTRDARQLHPVRHHLPLDAAAFLGAGAAQVRGIRQGRHPDDAERQGPGADPARDPALHAGAGAARRAALAHGPRRPGLRRRLAVSRRR